MDLEKLVKPLSDNAAAIVRLFVLTITKPLAFLLGHPRPHDSRLAQADGPIWMLTILSIVCGLAIWMVSHFTIDKLNLVSVLVLAMGTMTVLVVWLCFTGAAAGVLFVLSYRPQAHLIPVFLRVLAVTFVFANLSYLFATRVQAPTSSHNSPLVAYLITQLICTLCFMTAESPELYGATRRRSIGAGIVVSAMFGGLSLLLVKNALFGGQPEWFPPSALPNPVVWMERNDAGELPASAERTEGSAPLQLIGGSLSSPWDVDMYVIKIHDLAAFSIRAVNNNHDDLSLSLFDSTGRAIAFSDDSYGLEPCLSNAWVHVPGTYLLAVSAFPVAAYDQKNYRIWNPEPFTTERSPDGPSSNQTVVQWTRNQWHQDPQFQRRAPDWGTMQYMLQLQGVSTSDSR